MDMPGFPERARPNSLDPSRRTPAYSPPVLWTHSGADGPIYGITRAVDGDAPIVARRL
jgi:hypothetical protein